MPKTTRKKKCEPTLSTAQVVAPGWDGAIRLDLPLPTSTNAIWRQGRGRTYISASYKNWMARASEALEEQRAGLQLEHIGEHFHAAIMLSEKKRGIADLDNRTKASLDWAKKAGLIVDDKRCDLVVNEWGPIPASRALVWLVPAESCALAH